MYIYKYKNVFDHVEISLKERHGNDSRYSNVVFVLGYNSFKSLDDVKLKFPTSPIIIIQLEQLFDGSKWVNEANYRMLQQATEIWDYDQSNVEFIKKVYKINRVKHYPLFYTENLKNIEAPSEKLCDIDVLFYGYMNTRRFTILETIQNRLGDLKTINAFGIWGTELDSYISRAKTILNIHYYPASNIQEQVRLYYPIINSRCVISETSKTNYFSTALVECGYTHLVDCVKDMVYNGKWLNVAKNASNRFKQLSISRN